MKNNLKITISIFSILICFSAFAQRSGGQGGRGGGGGQRPQRNAKPDAAKILSMLDTNKDDKIDKSEASEDKRGRISQRFDEIDVNDDGFIDLEELKASLNNRKPRRKSAERVIKEVDDNGDGTLNQLEIAAKKNLFLKNNFESIDTNKDNEIDLEELRVFYAKTDKKEDKQTNRKRRRRN